MLQKPVDKRPALIYKPVILLLCIAYLVACFGPLRLEYDSIRYFAIKDCIDRGCAPDSKAANDFLPYGYPALLFLLSKIGLLKSFFISFVNAIFLFCSLYFIKEIIRPANRYLLLCTLILLHWTFIKLFAYPLSEMQYLFFSTASLYSYGRYKTGKKWHYLLLSFILVIVAMITRAIGAALMFALLVQFIWDSRELFIAKTKRWKIVIGVIVTGGIILFLFTKIPALKHYTEAFWKNEIENTNFGNLYSMHFKEWGQLLLNVPISKIENSFSVAFAGAFFLIVGILAFLVFVYVVFRVRSKIPTVIIIYISIYTIIIFNWPMYDPRFWVPILPFIISILIQQPMGKFKLAKFFRRVAIFAYLLIGLFGFGYSLNTQFHKETFARNQANGVYRNEYEIHFFGKTLSDTATHIDAGVVELLDKVDR